MTINLERFESRQLDPGDWQKIPRQGRISFFFKSSGGYETAKEIYETVDSAIKTAVETESRELMEKAIQLERKYLPSELWNIG